MYLKHFIYICNTSYTQHTHILVPALRGQVGDTLFIFSVSIVEQDIAWKTLHINLWVKRFKI